MFFDRLDSGEKTLLVDLAVGSEDDRDDPAEFKDLVLSAGAIPVAHISGARRQPTPFLPGVP